MPCNSYNVVQATPTTSCNSYNVARGRPRTRRRQKLGCVGTTRSRRLGAMTDRPADPPRLKVRQLVAADWAGLRQARLAALAEAPDAFASTLAREQAFEDDVWRDRAGSGATFGAFDGGSIVGLAAGFAVDADATAGFPVDADAAADTRAPAQAQPDWHLVGMWVAPQLRGQHVADR